MNICENCKHEFELQPGLIQVCPQCGQEIDSEASLEDLILESSSVGDESEDLDDVPDHDVDDDKPVLAETEIPDSLDDEFEITNNPVEISDDAQQDIVTKSVEDEDIQPTSQDKDVGYEETFVNTQDGEIDDNLLLPRIPVDGEQPQAKASELTVGDQEAITEQMDEDDFELQSDVPTDEATEAFDPEEKQPTIELENKAVSAASLDYAEREIVGLNVEDQDNEDADYIIAIHEKDSQLGSGASGVVYKATQKSLDRTVAIKLLKKQVKAGTQSQSRKTTPKQRDIEKFLYESQITAGLDHPNVITVHDLGVTSNNTLFYSMKLFEGGKDWSKDFDKNTLVENLDVFNDVCDAMRRAHRDRIIHRDLKPQNVLVGDFGEVQVTDWGLAIDLKLDSSKEFSGGGTPCYMSPEMSQHYLAQQELRTLRSKLDWTKTNAPNNSDEIKVLKEKIADNETRETEFSKQINELSDVYVLGAILFQIARGYPPHLFQISELHRRQWGSETGKNKVRRELEMSAKGTIANYIVKNLPNLEAREALQDIAKKAMAAKPENRFADVLELQRAVKDFRDFMRCIEDTQRGNREVEHSKEDSKSYVNLNNAIYAYEGALENYPDYQPANAGLAKARFLFAERALKNQDFELGLSTMTEDAIEDQPDLQLANQLRQDLINQRNRRDRRKQLLFLATMASLIAIGMGIVFGMFAIYARNEANRQIALVDEAKQEQVVAKQEVIDSFNDLVKTKAGIVELKIFKENFELTKAIAKQETEVANQLTQQAETKARLDQMRNKRLSEASQRAAQIAGIDKQIADINKLDAQIESEKIKEVTQYSQYVNRLKRIEGAIDEEIGKSELKKMFSSDDISLPVKNSWELHHLYKRAHPSTTELQDNFLGQFKLLEAARDADVIVGLSDQNQIVRFSSIDAKPKTIQIDCLEGCNVLSLDVSNDGRWLIVARDFVDDEFATDIRSLPVVYDMAKERRIEYSANLLEKLRFLAPRQDEDSPICKEKFYCRPQHVEFIQSDDMSMRLFMVDQRSRLGTNQIRCSVLNLMMKNNVLDGPVTKAKIAGKLFLRSPGLLTGTGCLASATQSSDGSIVAAVANSHPKFGVTVLSLDNTNRLLESSSYLSEPRSQSSYFRSMNNSKELFDTIAPEFAPTALKLTSTKGGNFSLLVGNGKGQVVEMEYELKPDAHLLTLSGRKFIRTDIRFDADASSRLVSNETKRINVTRQQSTYSTAVADAHSQTKGPNDDAPLHKSAVRKIEWIDGQLYSASESEIIRLNYRGGKLAADKRLFGQPGKIASLTSSRVNGEIRLFTASNLDDRRTRILAWLPNSEDHDATIQLEEFKDQSRVPKRIVAGTADKSFDSEAIALAFDDGSFEYFSPQTGRIAIDRPSPGAKLNAANKLSKDDFLNGKMQLFEQRQHLVFYSNAMGMLSWDLNDPNQSDPDRSTAAANLYGQIPTNSSVYFSADRKGQNIVTSHPTHRDRFVLWQLRDDGEYAPRSIGPFGNQNRQPTSDIGVSVEPAISPDGDTIAVIVRVRSAYRIVLIQTSPSQNLRKLFQYESDSRTSFRSLKFLDDDTIVASEDRVQSSIDRVTQLVMLSQADGEWSKSKQELPEFVTNQYRQVSIADASKIGNEVWFAGFGIPQESSTSDDNPKCKVTLDSRELFAFSPEKFVHNESIVFSRRIQPTFENQNLTYFVAGERSIPGILATVNVAASNQELRSFDVDKTTDSKAKRWIKVAKQHVAILGEDWFSVAKLDGQNINNVFDFSLNNQAQRIELAERNIVVHHQDQSVTNIELNTDPQKPTKIRRMNGFYDFVAISPNSKHTAVLTKDGNKTFVALTENTDRPDLLDTATKIPTKAIALTWLTGKAMQNLNLQGANKIESALATISRKGNDLQLNVWNVDGTPIALPEAFQRLRLKQDRNAAIESFTISNVTGELLSIVWDLDQENRADIWKYAINEKPVEGQDLKTMARSWFALDTSAVGRIKSVDFGEPLVESINVDKIAPRIVISSDNQGSKSIKLYALALGLEFKTKPLLDLTVTDELQQVDQMVGANFSGDGKTLLSMTAERARVRLTKGWSLQKNDVDFDSQIRIFNAQQKNFNIADLEKSKTALEKSNGNNAQEQTESELEKLLKVAVANVKQASSKLEEMKGSEQEEIAQIRKNMLQAEEAEVLQIQNDIANKEAELKTLKEELKNKQSN